MKDQAHINGETVFALRYDLEKSMICVEFIPHILTNEQNEHKVPTCEDFIWTLQTSPHFPICIIPGDESFVFQCNPVRKVSAWSGEQKQHCGPKSFAFEG